MPCWYYDKKELKNTPSALEGIEYVTEMRYRKEGARFIIDSGLKMALGHSTTATGVVYFHRFYMFHSFRQFPRYVTACCCLFLAGKVEETPKKCKDIIETARNLLSDAKFATFGDDPKEEVMTLERILLQTIKFDLQVEHPYNCLVRYAKSLKGDKVKLGKIVQMAWTFVNDSLCTTLCLQWEPEIIAVALMYLSCKLNQFQVVDWIGRVNKHLCWWDMFVEDITIDLLDDICHQVLDLYAPTASPPDSPPLLPRPQMLQASSGKATNGQEKEKLEAIEPSSNPAPPVMIPPEIPPYAYPSPFATTASHASTYQPPYTNPTVAAVAPPPHIPAPPPGPPPHLGAPPGVPFPPYVAPPPHYPPVVPPAPFFQLTPPPSQPHRPYYPPPS